MVAKHNEEKQRRSRVLYKTISLSTVVVGSRTNNSVDWEYRGRRIPHNHFKSRGSYISYNPVESRGGLIRAKRVSNCYMQEKKKLTVCVYVRLIFVLVLGRQIVYGQNTVYLCLSKYIVF